MNPKEREALRKQVVSAQTAIDNAPTTGSRGNYLKLPQGLKYFAPKADKEYRLNILPWKAGEGNKSGPKGSLVWVRYLYVHRNVGPSEEKFFCNASMGGPCAVCAQFAELRHARQPWDAIKDLRPQIRALVLVQNVEDNPQNIMVWEESAFSFLEPLMLKVQRKKSYIAFFSLGDAGRVIEVIGREQKIGNGSFTKYDSIEISDREEPVSDEMIDELMKLCPDEWIIKADQSRLKKLLAGTGGVAESNGQEPEVEDESDDDADGAVSEDEEEEIEEPSDLDEEDEPPPPKKGKGSKADKAPKPGKKPPPKEEPEEEEEPDDEDEEEEEDDEEEPEEEEEPEVEEDEDDEPPPPKKGKGGKGKK